MKLKTSEAGVVRACLEYLHARGVFAWRQNQVAVHGRRFVGLKGVADILGMTQIGQMAYSRLYGQKVEFREAGHLLAVECKTEDGRQSAAQKEFQKQLESRGGLYVIARSIDDLKAAGL